MPSKGLKLFAFLTILSVLALAAGPAWALTVKNVRLGIHPGKTRMVFDLSAKADFRAFVMGQDANRLVIDLPAFDWQAGQVGKPAGSNVLDVRQGPLDQGVSRIVIEMKSATVIRSAFLLPQDAGKPDRLVIDFSPAGPSDTSAMMAKTFGKLAAGSNMAAAAIPSAAPPVPERAPERREQETPLRAATFAAPPPPVQEKTHDIVMPARKPVVEESRPSASPRAAARGEKPMIIIDAGHGGADPGAAGPNGLSEKKITLAMAQELKRQLEATGRYRVSLTRDKDVYLRLHQRVAFARQNRGDLFISLHADSINKPGVRGASVYSLSDKASDEQTEMLAMRENRADLIGGVDLSAEDAVVASILVDLTMRDTMNQSRFLGNTVTDSLRKGGIRLLDNPHRHAGFAVLKSADIPSILVEMGFMSNPGEASMLAQPGFQQQLAAVLVSSIEAYFSRLRENSPT